MRFSKLPVWKKILVILANPFRTAGRKFMGLSMTKKVIAGIVAAAVTGTTVTGGVVFAKDYGSKAPEPLEAVLEVVPVEETETEEPVTEEVTEEETEETFAEELKLVGVSIEKDLKVKIQNSLDEDVTGYEFEITVTPDGKEEGKTYDDGDKDGVIYIAEIDAGDYSVALTGFPEDEEFIVPEPITVTVKDKIEYKKVDVSDQIKKDSQVSASEDAQKNNALPVESSAAATVESMTKQNAASAQTGGNTVSGSSVTISGLPQATITTSTGSVTLDLGTETVTPAPAVETPQPATVQETPSTEVPATETVQETSSATGASSAETAPIGVATVKPLMRRMLRTGETMVSKTATLTYPTGATLYNGLNATTASGALSVSPAVDGLSVTWTSLDPAVVTVTGNGLSFTLNAVAAGKTSVTAVITYNGKEAGNVTFPVEVLDLSGTVLKDASGNTLYMDAACTVVATAKDYSESATYYVQPTNTNTTGGARTGIDVSKWQGTINWAAVKASGVDFAIIRCGYRGSQTGVLVEDPTFRQNIQGATAAGLRVGVYFFTQAVSEVEAVEEASMCLQLCSGYNLALPIFIDTEDGARAQGLDRGTRTAIMNAFCQTIANSGRRPGVYASTSWYNTMLNAGSLGGWTIWVAQYAAACQYKGSYSMWQYTSKGSVPGVSGSCDMNVSFI